MRTALRVAALLGLFLSALIVSAQERGPVSPLAAETRELWSPERERLTEEYFLHHTGEATARLSDPVLIVVHYTGTDSVEASLRAFAPARLSGRRDIDAGGDLNVGVHYLIEPEGRIVALLPETVRGRHAIGYNHLSLGIELVASREDRITPAQADACRDLVADLADRYTSLCYLAGHHELADPKRPWGPLFLELDSGYRGLEKRDPGDAFMARLRSELALGGRFFPE